ncbi:MAG: alpha/beta hydrolase [Chloroflexi bacterium]|nr:alpha/beta hydrolase [Chloroflexota bacterium]
MPRSDDLRFRAGDSSLAGTLTLPDGDGPHPWVVFAGSWLPRGRDGDWDRVRHPTWFAPPRPDAGTGLLARLAEALAGRGVATLRYDPRGCGASDGAWESTDLFTRIDDARDAIGAMRSRDELDLRRCAIVGHGEGGVVAISVAIGDPALSAVGLIGTPARSLRDVVRHGVTVRAWTRTDLEHPVVAALDAASEWLIESAERRERELRIRIAGEAVRLGLAAFEQGIHTPAMALATMLHRNVVIAHGTADAWVSPDESRLLAALLREAGGAPDVHEIPDAGHLLAEADDEGIGVLAEAIAERIEARELPPVLVAIEQMRADPIDS